MLNKVKFLNIAKIKTIILIFVVVFFELALVNAALDKTTYAQRLEQWQKLTPEQRQIILQNYKKYQKMPEPEKKIVQENYQQWEKLPPPEREIIKQKVERFRQLPPERKIEIIEEKRPELKLRTEPEPEKKIALKRLGQDQHMQMQLQKEKRPEDSKNPEQNLKKEIKLEKALENSDKRGKKTESPPKIKPEKNLVPPKTKKTNPPIEGEQKKAEDIQPQKIEKDNNGPEKMSEKELPDQRTGRQEKKETPQDLDLTTSPKPPVTKDLLPENRNKLPHQKTEVKINKLPENHLESFKKPLKEKHKFPPDKIKKLHHLK